MVAVEQKLCVCNLTRQSFLSLGVRVADTHFTRLRGLIGRLRLRGDEGLWVVPCQGIHTVGLLFPIDAIYLDADFRVVHLIEHVMPFRIGPVRRRCHSVLELPPRTIYCSQTQPGDLLLVCSAEEMSAYWNLRQVRNSSG